MKKVKLFPQQVAISFFYGYSNINMITYNLSTGKIEWQIKCLISSFIIDWVTVVGSFAASSKFYTKNTTLYI